MSLLRIGTGSGTDDLLNRTSVTYRALITGHSVEEASNANVMYSADGYIYLHSPGDKLGSMTLSGMAFTEGCPDPNDPSGLADKASGFEKMLLWYRRYKLSSVNGLVPMTADLSGGTVLKGFLAGFSASVQSAEQRLYKFTLPMYLVPE
jgi:hypothetical protein